MSDLKKEIQDRVRAAYMHNLIEAGESRGLSIMFQIPAGQKKAVTVIVSGPNPGTMNFLVGRKYGLSEILALITASKKSEV